MHFVIVCLSCIIFFSNGCSSKPPNNFCSDVALQLLACIEIVTRQNAYPPGVSQYAFPFCVAGQKDWKACGYSF